MQVCLFKAYHILVNFSYILFIFKLENAETSNLENDAGEEQKEDVAAAEEGEEQDNE